MIANCELCKKENKEFKVPWDVAGRAIMVSHLWEKHHRVHITQAVFTRGSEVVDFQ